MATSLTQTDSGIDDPRRLRELLARTQELGVRHEYASVVVGFAAPEGDLIFPDFMAYVESELRVEDAIFRLTRERALLFLTDVKHRGAEEIVERLITGFRNSYPMRDGFAVEPRYFEIPPGGNPLAVKDVLPIVLGSRTH